MTENEEILDIYDGERRPMGYTKRRDEPLEPGEFIVAVGIWIVDDKGRLLITKRSMKKRYAPGKWENTGGHLMHGEEPVAAVMRELYEETGIKVARGRAFLGHGQGAALFRRQLHRACEGHVGHKAAAGRNQRRALGKP